MGEPRRAGHAQTCRSANSFDAAVQPAKVAIRGYREIHKG